MTPKQSTFSLYILFFLSLLVLFLCLYLIFPFLMVIFWAGILAFYLFPLYKKMYLLIKKRAFTALFTVLIFIFFILVPFLFIGILLYYQIQNIIQDINEATLQTIINQINLFTEKLRHLRVYPYLEHYIIKLQQELPHHIPKLLENIVKQFSGVLFFTFGFIFKIFFTLFTLYYFLVDGTRIIKIIKELIPGDEEEKERILTRISLILKGVLYGNILTGLIQGILALVIYYIFGVPFYILFAFFTMIASFIPFLGTGIIWIPLSLYFLFTGSIIKGIILFILCAITIAQIDNILKPFLIGGKTKLHNLLVFFSVLGGINQFGLTGLFLGPILLGFFLSLLEIYKIKILNHQYIKNSDLNNS